MYYSIVCVPQVLLVYVHPRGNQRVLREAPGKTGGNPPTRLSLYSRSVVISLLAASSPASYILYSLSLYLIIYFIVKFLIFFFFLLFYLKVKK